MNASQGQLITVVLADDHPLLREALRSVLERQPDIQVIGEACDGEEAVRLVCRLKPRVAVLDISMPGLSGIEAAERIKSLCPEVMLLLLTVHDEIEYTRRMLEIGAAGYITKDAPVDRVVQAVRAVASGDIILSPAVLKSIVQRHDAPTAAAPDGGPLLTERELRILKLTARGLTNPQVAQECGLSPRTVRGHLEDIFDKLQVTNRTEAVAAALRLGIISVDDLGLRS